MSKLDNLEAWQAKMMAFDWSEAPPPMGLPRHRMGVHLIGNREADLQYIETLRPPAVKIVDPDPNVVRRVLNALDPSGVCILRDHPLSEQKGDMAKDPTGTGIRHAKDWVDKLGPWGRFAAFNGDRRIVVCGINEPDVHNVAEEIIVLKYTMAFLEELTKYGIRGLALNLSVGWPRNLGEGQPPTWDTFKPLEPVINKGGHFLCVHEYWYPNPQDKWGWYGNRISHCPLTCPIIIGECGYTRQLIRMDIPQPWGWRGNMPAPSYADQLWYYHDKVDPNVFAVLPFTTGFGGPEWESKDTQPAHADILGRVRAYTFPNIWPVKKGEPTQPPPGDAMLLIAPKYTGKVSGFYGQVYQGASGAYAHEGLDIVMPEGTPLYAAADGVVAWADPTEAEKSPYGKYVRTYHPQLDVCFFYGHMTQVVIQTGNSVKQGQLLGYSGNTGNSTGPHCHLEVRLMTPTGTYRTGVSAKANGRVDPLAFLEGWKAQNGKVEER